MKATVTYSEDGEPVRFKVSERYGHVIKFTMDGTTAVATMAEPAEGEPDVFFDDLSRLLDYAESLPFVQAAELAEYEPNEVPE